MKKDILFNKTAIDIIRSCSTKKTLTEISKDIGQPAGNINRKCLNLVELGILQKKGYTYKSVPIFMNKFLEKLQKRLILLEKLNKLESDLKILKAKSILFVNKESREI